MITLSILHRNTVPKYLMPPGKSANLKISFLICQPNHMLCVLLYTHKNRLSKTAFLNTHTNVKIDG